jgi:small subunit ribosomal protein S18
VANQRNKRSRVKPSDARSRLRRGRPKVCLVCADRIEYVDYKNTAFLRRFMSDRGKIKSRANTGTCVQHQHEVAIAIKNAREVALLPYAVRTMAADKGGGRRGRGGPGGRPDRAGPGAPSGPAQAEASSDEDFEAGADAEQTENGGLGVSSEAGASASPDAADNDNDNGSGSGNSED